jgi:hypothetical protein
MVVSWAIQFSSSKVFAVLMSFDSDRENKDGEEKN